MFDTSLSPKKSHKVATSQSAGLWHRNQSWSTVRGIETKNWSDCNGNLLEIREKISEKPKFCEKSAGNLSFLGILRESVGKKNKQWINLWKHLLWYFFQMFNDFPMDQVVACVVGFTPLQSETPPGGFKDRLKWQLLSSMLQFKSKDGLNVNPSFNFTQWRIHSH